MHALILTSPATSLKQQGRYVAQVLLDAGWSVYVVDYNNAYLAYRYVALHDPKLAVNVIDPLVLPYIARGVNGFSGEAITYYTADGVPHTDLARQHVRQVCRGTYVITNSAYSKANLEVIDCHVNEIIPNGIDWVGLGRFFGSLPRYDLSSVGYYNPGINEISNNWWGDRKGHPALVGLLYRLWWLGHKYTAHLHTSPELLTRVFRAFTRRVGASLSDVSGLRLMISSVDYDFFAVNREPDEKHPVKVTYIGGEKDVGSYYDGEYYVSNSYVEGFGLTPFEALAVGRYAIVNDLPTWREHLPSDCVSRVPIHATKDYVWGFGINKLLMRFHIPDFNVWWDLLTRAISHEIKYDPALCRESVREYDYRLTYEWFRKKL
jgi:hypothetical protein